MTKTISKTKTVTAIVLAVAFVGVAGFSASLFLNSSKKISCAPCPVCEKCDNCGAEGDEKQSGDSDLVITSASNAGSISNGNFLTVEIVVKNQGTGTAGPSRIRSTRGKTTWMFDVNVPSIAAGQTVKVRGGVAFPCTTHSTYNLYHNADGYSEVAETDETNNQRVGVVTCNR